MLPFPYIPDNFLNPRPAAELKLSHFITARLVDPFFLKKNNKFQMVIRDDALALYLHFVFLKMGRITCRGTHFVTALPLQGMIGPVR